jgi:hypothetical protein
VTFEVLAAVNVQITVFWDVTSCSLVRKYSTSRHVSEDCHLLSGVAELNISEDQFF